MALLYVGFVPLAVQLINGVQVNQSWQWDEQSTIELLPRQQYTGPGGKRISVSALLHPLLGVKPQAALDALEALGDRGQAFAVQRGDGRLVGWFVLDNMAQDWQKTLPDGTLFQASVTLVLKPDRPPEDPTLESPPAVEGSVVGVDAVPQLVDIDRDPSEVSLAEIVRSG